MSQEAKHLRQKTKFLTLNEGRSLVLDASDLDLNTAYLDVGLKGVGFEETTRHFWASTEYFLGEDFTVLLAKICKAHGYALNHENLIACLDTMQAGFIVKSSDLHLACIGAYLPALSFQMPDQKTDGPLLQSFYNEVEQIAQARMLAIGNHTAEPKDGTGGKSNIKTLQEQIDYLTLKNSGLQRQLQESATVGFVQAIQTGSDHNAELMIGKIQDIDANSRQVKVRAAGKSLTLQFEELSSLPSLGQTCAIYLDAKVRPHKLITFRSEQGQIEVEPNYKRAKVLAQRDGLIKIRTEDGEIWQVIQKAHEPTLRRGALVIVQFQAETLLRIINVTALRRGDDLINLVYVESLRLHVEDSLESDDYLADTHLEAEVEPHQESASNKNTRQRKYANS